jgi:hypothetical protein
MRVLRAIVLAATLALALPFATPPPTVQAANCEFVLGFKAIHDMIPDVVGDCLVSEHHGTNGDGLQETKAWHGKGGLLVWRKSDNWTAFTDGANTWVNGPNGLQKRGNGERFCPWEANPEKLPCVGDQRPPQPTPGPITSGSGQCTVPASAVTQTGVQKEADGAATWSGVVRNPCPSTATLLIDVRAYQTDGGPATMDSLTIIAADMPPGSTREVSTRVPGSASAARFGWQAATVNPDTLGCMGQGGTKCLTDDPYVANAIWSLRGLQDGLPLLQTASNAGIKLERTAIQDQVLAGYSPSRKTVYMNTRLDRYSMWVRGAVLAHELQHVADGAAGRWPTTNYECYHFEENAFRTEARVWSAMWQGRLPANVDPLHAELNRIATAVFQDPEGFFKALVDLYHPQCEM